MTLLQNHRVGAESIMPPPGPAVQRRMLAVVHAMGGQIQQSSSASSLQGCLVLPFAGMILAGTACARPLLFAECDALAQNTDHDVVVLRHDALRGTTFDIKLASEPRWFGRYLATSFDDGVRMEPHIGAGPVFRASALGLEVVDHGDGSVPSPLKVQRNASFYPVEA